MSDNLTTPPRKNLKRPKTPETTILSSKKKNRVETPPTPDMIRIKLNETTSIKFDRNCLLQQTNNKLINYTKPVGCGMSGCVYDIEDVTTGVIKVVKIIDVLNLRQQEIDIQKICAKINVAPHIYGIPSCKVESSDKNLKTVFCVIMEKFESNLHDYVKDGKPLTVDMAKQFVRLCELMSSKYVMHNDMKPDNVVITKTGEYNQFNMKIIDFGRSYVNRPSEPFQFKDGWMRATIPKELNRGIEPYKITQFDPYWDIFNMYAFLSKHFNNENERRLVHYFREYLIKYLQRVKILQGLYIYNNFDFTARLGKKWINPKDDVVIID